MTPKERAAMQQALNLLESEWPEGDEIAQPVIDALREALANTRSSIWSASEYSEQAEQALQKLSDFHQSIEQAEQEPVAWAVFTEDCLAVSDVSFEGAKPLYAAPVRTKDLTDGEIDEIGKSYFDEWSFGFARAVIAADREKNNANNNT